MLVNKITGKPPSLKTQQPEVIPPPPLPPLGFYHPMQVNYNLILKKILLIGTCNGLCK